MSVSKPQNRAEFKKHILTKLGAPVLEVNVADEQMDVAIDDAFQFFNERNHFNGVERVYLSVDITPQFKEAFGSFDVYWTGQDSGYTVHKRGMVAAIQMVSPGSGYAPNNKIYQATTRNPPDSRDILTDAAGDNLLVDDPTKEVAESVTVGFLRTDDVTMPDGTVENKLYIEPEYNTRHHLPQTDALVATDFGDNSNFDTLATDGYTANGSGFTVKVHPPRTVENGLIHVEPYNLGSGYEVGDYIIINGGNGDSIWMVTETKEEGPLFGTHPVKQQNNYFYLPEHVVGVTRILRGRRSSFGGMIPGASLFPLMMGGMAGNHCDNAGFGLAQYWIMQSYLALLDFMFFPPKMYNFNQRTHRLHIDGDLGDVGQTLVLETMVKPSPDVFPDLWNDMWLKEFATALVKAQWGRNLTKYNQVQLPGGIVINGERILGDAQKELDTIRQRFAMDWADPCLDAVG